MIKGDIWNDLEELRAEYSLRVYKYLSKTKDYPPESKYFNKYKALSIHYLKAHTQLYNILNCGHLDEIMNKAKDI